MSELTDLLRHAFPRLDRLGDPLDGQPVCAFCGASRKSDHALCRRCWYELRPSQRARYMRLDIEARARMLLAILDGTDQ